MLIILFLLLLYYENHIQKEGLLGKALVTSLMPCSPCKAHVNSTICDSSACFQEDEIQSQNHQKLGAS